MTPESKGILLHLGLPKTGTTTIQRALFLQHPQIYYMGKVINKENRSKQKCRNDLVYQVLENILWNYNKPVDQDKVERLVRDQLLPDVQPGQHLVASWEELGQLSTDRHIEMLKKAVAVFGRCRIMITLRNPLKMLPSEYLQNLKGHYIKSAKPWMGPSTYLSIDDWYKRRKMFGPKAAPLLNYPECIRASVELLGEENVGVFLFEELKENPAEYYRSICEFMAVETSIGIELTSQSHLHERIKEAQIDFLKGINSSWLKRYGTWLLPKKSRRRSFNRFSGGEAAKTILPEGLVEEIKSAVGEGHRWLADNFDLPLERYGYPI
ncbi:MAG: hypothetical protein C0615_12510 [Desulfuromonas sp.]|nr:MAG: hypothetical protein C0615_12510 [Desulfuromonas sp.]